METLYNYIFWHNPYERIWYAIERDTEMYFFNGNRDLSTFYKSKEVSTLVDLLTKPSLKRHLEK